MTYENPKIDLICQHCTDGSIKPIRFRVQDEEGIQREFNIKYEKEFHNKLFKDNEIAFVYVYLGEIDIDDITVQEEELECVEWFDLEETYNECLAHNQKFCVPVKGLETARQYLDSMNK